MTYSYSSYAIVILLFAPITVLMAMMVWPQRKQPGARSLMGMLLALSIWSLAAGLETAIVAHDRKILFAKILQIGFQALPAFMLCFALYISQKGNWLKGWVRVLIWLIPVISILLAWTNESHYLFWSEIIVDKVLENNLLYVHGPAFTVSRIAHYLLILAALGLMVWRAFQTRRAYQLQFILLVIWIPAWLAVEILYNWSIGLFAGMDLTPIALTLFGTLFIAMLSKEGELTQEREHLDG